MPRYRPGDHVLFHFYRHDLIRLQIRTGSSWPPEFEVLRVLPAGHDREHAYEVRCQPEPYARVAKEHELPPAA